MVMVGEKEIKRSAPRNANPNKRGVMSASGVDLVLNTSDTSYVRVVWDFISYKWSLLK